MGYCLAIQQWLPPDGKLKAGCLSWSSVDDRIKNTEEVGSNACEGMGLSMRASGQSTSLLLPRPPPTSFI